MKVRFYFVFAVLYFTAILIFATNLRIAKDRNFYQIYRQRTHLARLRQQLGSKQLRLENLINPAAVSEHLNY